MGWSVDHEMVSLSADYYGRRTLCTNAWDLITQERHPPTHALLLSLTYMQVHLLNNKATVVQIFWQDSAIIQNGDTTDFQFQMHQHKSLWVK